MNAGLFVFSILILISNASIFAKSEPEPRLQFINGDTETLKVFELKRDAAREWVGEVPAGDDLIVDVAIGDTFVMVGADGSVERTVTSQVPVQAVRFDPVDPGGIPPFYSQRLYAEGYPIVASERVNPYALKEAAYLVNLMLAERPDLRQAMIRSGSRLCILAHDELTTDQPDFARLGQKPAETFPGIAGKDYWDARARGLGGSTTDPYCSCAEENLLAYEGDPYFQENILIHEFAHNIHLRGLVNLDPTFDQRLRETYQAAIKKGLWRGKYASVNHHEYFAEGVQSWFDDNRENDHDHNHVNTRKELIEYDPGLAALCREVFGETELKYTKPTTRLTGHLKGYEPDKAPGFVWPEHLISVKKQIREAAEARNAAANPESAETNTHH